MISLETLKPIIVGPFRDDIIRFEGSDWCCRQASLYLAYALRQLGIPARLPEGTVIIGTWGAYPEVAIDHAWVDVDGLTIDLTLTQVNWTLRDVDCEPLERVGVIWGNDPPHVVRSIEFFHSIDDLLQRSHWRKGIPYREIVEEMFERLTSYLNGVIVC